MSIIGDKFSSVQLSLSSARHSLTPFSFSTRTCNLEAESESESESESSYCTTSRSPIHTANTQHTIPPLIESDSSSPTSCVETSLVRLRVRLRLQHLNCFAESILLHPTDRVLILILTLSTSSSSRPRQCQLHSSFLAPRSSGTPTPTPTPTAASRNSTQGKLCSSCERSL